jgi:hypothetical protein
MILGYNMPIVILKKLRRQLGLWASNHNIRIMETQYTRRFGV